MSATPPTRSLRRDRSLGKIPSDLRKKLEAWLSDTSISQAEATAKLNDYLAARGETTRVSVHAVGRYDRRMRRISDRLRESRQIAEAWVDKLAAAPEGQVGRLLNEILRTLAFDISLKLHEGELTEQSLPRLIEQLKKLSATAQTLERTASENLKLHSEIERRAAEKLVSEAEKRMAGGKPRVTPERLREIVRDVYGSEPAESETADAPVRGRKPA